MALRHFETVVTRAQARKFNTDLSDTFMSLENPFTPSRPRSSAHRSLSMSSGAEISNSALPLPIDRELIMREQKKDPSLAKCHASAAGKGDVMNKYVAYYWENDLLMRKWTPSQGWNTACQLVVPAKFRCFKCFDVGA